MPETPLRDLFFLLVISQINGKIACSMISKTTYAMIRIIKILSIVSYIYRRITNLPKEKY